MWTKRSANVFRDSGISERYKPLQRFHQRVDLLCLLVRGFLHCVGVVDEMRLSLHFVAIRPTVAVANHIASDRTASAAP